MQKLALEEHFEAPGIETEDYDGAIFRSFDATAAAEVHRRLKTPPQVCYANARRILKNLPG
jgi:hypothetical protein